MLEITIANKEYIPLIYDILRMMSIQITIQFLYYINTDDNPFFTADFFLLLIYIVLGVCVYWLIIKKVLMFK